MSYIFVILLYNFGLKKVIMPYNLKQREYKPTSTSNRHTTKMEAHHNFMYKLFKSSVD